MFEKKILTDLIVEPENTIVEISRVGPQIRLATVYRGLDFAVIMTPDKVDEYADALKAAAAELRALT